MSHLLTSLEQGGVRGRLWGAIWRLQVADLVATQGSTLPGNSGAHGGKPAGVHGGTANRGGVYEEGPQLGGSIRVLKKRGRGDLVYPLLSHLTLPFLYILPINYIFCFLFS